MPRFASPRSAVCHPYAPSRRARVLLAAVILCIAASFQPAGAQTAFRFSSLVLRDPHTFALIPIFGCRDITDTFPLGLGTPFNEMLRESIEMDADGDGSLDLNGLIYFVPEDVVVGTAGLMGGTQWDPDDADGELIFHFGACTPPFDSPVCEPDLTQAIHRLEYANDAASPCLETVGGTLNGSYVAPTLPGSPCFATEPFEMLLDVGGIPVPLVDVRLGATYVGGMPPRLVDGLVSGFLMESVADSVLLPAGLPLIGGQPLSSLLPGGTGNCASHDDRDQHQGESGWWVYLDFEAEEVPFTAVTAAPEQAGPRVASRVVTLTATPNPFRDGVMFRPPRDGSGRLDVLDVRGRVVRVLGNAGSGRDGGLRWDGADANGNPVPAGVYFARWEGAGGRVVRKVVRTH